MSPAALANVHIKDRTHAGMQAVPALLAILHGVSGHDDATDAQKAARAREDEAEHQYRAYEARQRPATAPAASSAAPREFSYKVAACVHSTSAQIITMIADSEAETRRLQALLVTTIAKTGRLRLDLATKRLHEASGP